MYTVALYGTTIEHNTHGHHDLKTMPARYLRSGDELLPCISPPDALNDFLQPVLQHEPFALNTRGLELVISLRSDDRPLIPRKLLLYSFRAIILGK